MKTKTFDVNIIRNYSKGITVRVKAKNVYEAEKKAFKSDYRKQMDEASLDGYDDVSGGTTEVK